MKFSIRALSDGGSSPSSIGQLNSTVSQLEERLKIVELACKEAMKKLGKFTFSGIRLVLMPTNFTFFFFFANWRDGTTE